jgi:hypothetical protein
MIISRDKHTHIEKNRETQGEKLIIYRESQSFNRTGIKTRELSPCRERKVSKKRRSLKEQVFRLDNSVLFASTLCGNYCLVMFVTKCDRWESTSQRASNV